MNGSHDHAAPATLRTRLAIALAITVTILIAEIMGAIWTNSLALLVDAGHMLTDATGLLIALIAASLALRRPTPERTWGYRRAEVLAAGAQAAVLLGVGVYAFVEGIRRLQDPPQVAATGLLVFGIVGLVGNVISMLVLTSGRGASLNMRAAFLEVVNDALGPVAVIISAIVIALTGWTTVDALAGMLIAALIVPRAITILREAGSILLESTPPGLDLEDVRRHLGLGRTGQELSSTAISEAPTAPLVVHTIPQREVSPMDARPHTGRRTATLSPIDGRHDNREHQATRSFVAPRADDRARRSADRALSTGLNRSGARNAASGDAGMRAWRRDR